MKKRGIMQKEIWKEIRGYEGLYYVSNLGNVRSVKRAGTKGGILKPKKRKGYFAVDLVKNGVYKTVDVHRLVAIAFIENLDNLPQVNHKDENRTNNNTENLEWCDARYNTNYGTARTRGLKTREDKARPFICLETGKIYKSQKNFSEEVGVSFNHTSNVLAGRRKTAKGYHIQYI